MTKVFNHEIKLLKFKFNVIFGDSIIECFQEHGLYKTFCKSFGNKKDGIDVLNSSNAMTCHIEAPGLFIMALPFNVTAGTIAHECFHLTVMIMQTKGMSLCSENEEAFAYTLDYLVTVTNDMLNKTK